MIQAKKLRWVLIAALLSVLAFGSFHEYRSQQETARRLTGTVEVTKADITAKTNGYLQQLYIKEGDSVKKGMTAAVLDRQDLAAALLRDEAARQKAGAQLTALENGARPEDRRTAAANTEAARAAADKAAQDYTRAAALYGEGAISRAAYDEASANRDATAARCAAAQEQENLLAAGTRAEDLDAARDELRRTDAILAISRSAVSDLTVICPLNGFILTKNYEPGEYVTAGTPIATVADLSDCWVRVYVASPELANIRIGSPADVYIDARPDRPLRGQVREISDRAEFTPRQSITKNERANLVFAVKVAIDNGDGLLKPGMPADVIFHE